LKQRGEKGEWCWKVIRFGVFSLPPLLTKKGERRKGGMKEGMNESINKLERRHYDVSDWAETGGYFVDMMFPSKVQHPLIE
jgi:hypothetical protein